MKVRDGAVWNVVSRITSNNAYEAKSSADWLDLTGGTLDMTYATVQKKTNWEGADHRQHLTLTDTSERGGLTGTGGTISFGQILEAGDYTILAINPTTTCQQWMTGTATVVVNNLGSNPSVCANCLRIVN
jgi:hypothetical protein